jgi:hypothetical protein
MSLVILAVAALAAPTATAQAAAAPAAKPVPMVVLVEAPSKAGADVEAWAKELRTALAARKDEFRLAKPGEKAELVVRIDSVATGEGDSHSMNAALVLGKSTRPFNLSYAGEVHPQAEALARNLRKLIDQMKKAES